MRQRTLIILVVGLFVVVVFAQPIFSQSESILVTGADWVQAGPLVFSPDLAGLAGEVGPRFSLNYANLIEYKPLAAVPQLLGDHLGGVSERVFLNYAQRNQQVGLDYPLAWLEDTTAPEVEAVRFGPFDNGTMGVTWWTDEYATGAIRYGQQPGLYPWVVSSTLYLRKHPASLPGLAAGARYYYQLSGVDRSGNAYLGPEGEFLAANLVYLPLVD